MQSTQIILNNIQKIQDSSQNIKNYINSLDKEEYVNLATAYNLGRAGWEQNYFYTDAYYSFIEKNEDAGIEVTLKILDAEFLTKDIKKKQVQSRYNLHLANLEKHDEVYDHDWLGMKPNLIKEVQKGLDMLREIS